MRKPTRVDARSAIRCAVAEVLEPRRLFAAIESGILVARGTASADTISLRRTGTDDVIVTTNGVNQTFDMDNFTGVRLEGLGGNDTFNLIDALTSPLVRNTTVLGGAGSDTISYATRTAALNFLTDPAGSSMTSGAQTDVFDDVETVIGGSGNDAFEYRNGFSLPEEEQDLRYDFRLEGHGGNDRFISGLVSTISRDVGVTLFGGAGDDFFEQDDMGGRVFAEAGNDTIVLQSREASYEGWLDGGTGVDVIDGAGGAFDVFDLREYANIENAILDGGFTGTAYGTNGPNLIDGSAADAVTINGLDGNDTLVGGGEADSLNGGAGDDTLLGQDGNDTLNGGDGNDLGNGGFGTNTFISVERLGSEDPTDPSLTIENGVLVVRGTDGVANQANDNIRVNRIGTDNVTVRVNDLVGEFDMDDFPGGVLIETFGGDDVIVIADSLNAPVARRVTINGGAGNDTLIGNDGNDSLLGGDGNDQLIGKAGNDTLDGGAGTDFADGGPGTNTHRGIEEFAGSAPTIAIVNRTLTATGSGYGNTIEISRTGTDDVIVRIDGLVRQFDMDDFDGVLLQGLGGDDTITILDAITAGALTRKVTLDGGGGNDSLTGNGGDDVLRGGDGLDTLVGAGGRDALSGNAGNDQLFGGTGLDFLDGGDNDDFIDASDGVGGDTVLGGNGSDTADVDTGDSTSGVETFV